MEFESKPKFSDKLTLGDVKDNDGVLSMNLYKTVPYGQLTLGECEDLFRQRLEALHIMERSDLIEKNIPDINNRLRTIKSHVYKANCIVLNKMDFQDKHRQDSFSHLLLRMYCVYQSNLWPWFKTNEKRLFLFRLKDQATSLSGAQLETILRGYNFNFERVTGSELSELIRENLIGWDADYPEKVLTDIFKVKFTDALKFVSRRSVCLKDGYAYLKRYEIISVVADAFERHLEVELQFARQHLNIDLLQTRQLIESLNLVYQDYQEKIDEEERKLKREKDNENKLPYPIDIENIEQLVKDHFPPCMRYLHESLRADHHLKYAGRLHYGAFLRSGQVDLDTAIEFWRKEFTQKMTNDKFERDYKYNIRHLYGKEGQNKALTCFGCDKIINENPGTSEKHGCPFKHFDDSHLKAMLAKHGLKEVDSDSILMKRNKKDFKSACTKYFEYSKGYPLTDTIRNPIQFYYESRRLADRPPQAEADNQVVTDAFDDPAMEFDDDD